MAANRKTTKSRLRNDQPPPEANGMPADASTRTRKTAASRKPKSTKAEKQPKVKKTSALDAAAKVLAEQGKPMNCQEMIDAMAAKGYWTSPGGLTPAATLYSALLRETTTKGAQARFVKTEPGKFALRG